MIPPIDPFDSDIRRLIRTGNGTPSNNSLHNEQYIDDGELTVTLDVSELNISTNDIRMSINSKNNTQYLTLNIESTDNNRSVNLNYNIRLKRKIDKESVSAKENNGIITLVADISKNDNSIQIN